MPSQIKITVAGVGYVGLVTGTCLAEFGSSVTCVDIDTQKIAALKKGLVPFYEPGLQELVHNNISRGRLKFTNNLSESVSSSEIIFIAVGTPSNGNGTANLDYVKQVAKNIAVCMDNYKLIVTKSTVPVGTGEMIHKIISENLNEKVDYDVASNPEFLREGAAVEDSMKPNRIILGVNSKKAEAILRNLYRPLNLISIPTIVTDIKTAELIKYASNAFLATKISFINEMANLCDEIGADIHVVAKAMGLDQRIGSKFLHPGPGYGGSCFPKDTEALSHTAREYNTDLKVVRAAIEANDDQRKIVLERIRKKLGGVKGKTIAALGLSFKPNTDDIRCSSALFIIDCLLKEGAKIRAYDPAAGENAKKSLPQIDLCRDSYSTTEGADAVIIFTEWTEFRNLDLEEIKKRVRHPYFFDLKNIYNPHEVRSLGFDYTSVGRSNLNGAQKEMLES